jgi:hypothetical protein
MLMLICMVPSPPYLSSHYQNISIYWQISCQRCPNYLCWFWAISFAPWEISRSTSIGKFSHHQFIKDYKIIGASQLHIISSMKLENFNKVYSEGINHAMTSHPLLFWVLDNEAGAWFLLHQSLALYDLHRGW